MAGGQLAVTTQFGFRVYWRTVEFHISSLGAVRYHAETQSPLISFSFTEGLEMKTDKLEVQLFQLLLSHACDEALIEFESYKHITKRRLGIANGEYLTLYPLCDSVGLTINRVTEMVNRALKLIHLKGRRQLAHGQNTTPCAQLQLYLDERLGDTIEGYLESAIRFAIDRLPRLTPKFATHAILQLHNPWQEPSLYERAKPLVDRVVRVARAESRRNQDQADWKYLMQFVLWPRNPNKRLNVDRHRYQRAREVTQNENSYSGSIYSKKNEREVQFESKLERSFYLGLEEVDEVSWYQEQPCEVPYEHKGKSHKYYPDSLIALTDGRGIVAEIKPPGYMPSAKNLSKLNELFKYCTSEGLGMLVTNGSVAMQELLLAAIDKEFEQVLVDRLVEGPLYQPEYDAIASRYPRAAAELPAIVLRRGLEYEIAPFVIRASNTHTAVEGKTNT